MWVDLNGDLFDRDWTISYVAHCNSKRERVNRQSRIVAKNLMQCPQRDNRNASSAKNNCATQLHRDGPLRHIFSHRLLHQFKKSLFGNSPKTQQIARIVTLASQFP